MLKKPPSRRDFLRHSASLLGGAWLGIHGSAIWAAAESASKAMAGQAAMNHLTAREAGVLAAAADQIFPPDETPGASELGAVYFIDAALGGFMAGAASLLRDGVADLDQRAQAAHGLGFSELGFEQQTGLMQQVENTPFFGTLHFLTLIGIFASPSYGGNRNGQAWQLIGFESRHVWQAPYGYYDAEYAGENAHASS